MAGRTLLTAGFAFAIAALATAPLYGTDWGVLSPACSALSTLCALALAFVYRGRKYSEGIGSRKLTLVIGIVLFAALMIIVSYFNLKTVGAPGHNYWQALQLFLVDSLLLAQQMMRKKPIPVS